MTKTGAMPKTGAMIVRRVVPDIRVESEDEMRASSDFYASLGLEEVMNLGWVTTLASPSNPTAQITFSLRDRTAPVDPDLSVEVADVDEVHARLLAAGAEIVHGPRDEEWGVRRFFVRDPTGRVVNVVSHRR
ncbi:catechol 2,3-dioxygenase-like lactoylglutathione lyase family enzyme [Streptomyces sp. MAA16]|nr:catechol 2,3-dioxygenase-like lactoylglutathione lyase family enzyme [Streptomyces sp. MAA16]